MGWTGTHRFKGMTDKEFFQKEFGDKHIILESASIGGPNGTFYAAVQTVETGEVWGYVVMKHYDRRDYWNFLYKEMDETSGPYQIDCPTRILDLLSETDNEHANEWRARCRHYAAMQDVIREAVHVKVERPIRFRMSGEVTEFEHRGRYWFDPKSGRRLRVSIPYLLQQRVVSAVNKAGEALKMPTMA